MSMSEEKRAKLKDLRRQLILETSLVLFLEKGFKNTTVQDIADAAGISKGLIYRYFSSKNEILEAEAELIASCEEECASIPTAMEALELYARRLLSDSEISGYFPPLRVYITCYIQGQLSNEMQERYFANNHGREYFGRIMLRGQEMGEIRDGDPEEMGSIFWNYLLGAAAKLVCCPGYHYSQKDIDSFLDLFRRTN
ncbi:MAG: TetR/AcrR family transcriptional regulator [Synergistaceae bacterium]|nr:TetR/AcrR family transcriptional regulator [Synergistaceae bacterium]